MTEETKSSGKTLLLWLRKVLSYFLMNQYNFSRTTFYYWKKQLRKAKEEHETDEVARRIRALEKEKAELEIENEILKKQSRLSGKSSCNRRPFP